MRATILTSVLSLLVGLVAADGTIEFYNAEGALAGIFPTDASDGKLIDIPTAVPDFAGNVIGKWRGNHTTGPQSICKIHGSNGGSSTFTLPHEDFMTWSPQMINTIQCFNKGDDVSFAKRDTAGLPRSFRRRARWV